MSSVSAPTFEAPSKPRAAASTLNQTSSDIQEANRINITDCELLKENVYHSSIVIRYSFPLTNELSFRSTGPGADDESYGCESEPQRPL